MMRTLNDNKENLQLGVNIDHVATLRQARGTRYPDPVSAVAYVEAGGADGITIHLREDRRHIQLRDVEIIHQVMLTRLNLEMALTDEMLNIATRIKPEACCLVPEKRQELTTEGGLDVITHQGRITQACQQLQACGTRVSLFIDPEATQVEAAIKVGANMIELHTGCYADAPTAAIQQQELAKIIAMVNLTKEAGLQVNAGHGLNYQNVQAIAAIPGIVELNIGHSIIAQALFCGLERAVAKMKKLMQSACPG